MAVVTLRMHSRRMIQRGAARHRLTRRFTRPPLNTRPHPASVPHYTQLHAGRRYGRMCAAWRRSELQASRRRSQGTVWRRGAFEEDSVEQLEISTAQDALSDDYNQEMQQKMGDDSLIYRHEHGMNYAYLTDDVIIGSCLQTPNDVDTLAEKEGVSTILCLQENVNLDYFEVDIAAIQQRCAQRGDIRHVRCPIRDFDPMDLRLQLPKVVAMICQQHYPEENERIYIHCTAGLGRAPAVALAYMFWCREWTLEAANHRLQKVRPCGPKLHAIRQATCDLVFGAMQHPITIAVTANPSSHVQIAGLDLGWGMPHDLTYIPAKRRFELQRALNPGKYAFKFIIDGSWTCSVDYPISADGDNENNVINVTYDTTDSQMLSAISRLLSEQGLLTQNETWKLHAALKKLEPCNDACAAL